MGEAAICAANYLAVRVGMQLQVYDMTKREKLRSLEVSGCVRYWKFSRIDQITLVVDDTVYRWNWGSGGDVTAHFTLFEELKDHRIMDVRSNSANDVHLVRGLTAKRGELLGMIHVYSDEYQESQCIVAHAADFCEWTGPSGESTTLLCAAHKVQDRILIHVSEIKDVLSQVRQSAQQRNSLPLFGTRLYEHSISAGREKDFPVVLHAISDPNSNHPPLFHVVGHSI